MSNIKIGIIVADNDEFAPFEKYISNLSFSQKTIFGRKAYSFNFCNCEVLAINCGIGKVNAAVATAAVIDYGCNYVFNYGLSGGISSVNRGELVLPKTFLEHDFDLTGIGYKPCEKPSQEYIYRADDGLIFILSEIIGQCKTGMAVSGDRFVCTKEESSFLKNEFGAQSCDMETAAIAYACNAAGVPFASLRRISDDADDSAVDNYRDMNSTADAMPFEIILKAIEKISLNRLVRR